MLRGLLLFSALGFAQTYTTTILAGGSPYTGDGGPAVQAMLGAPRALALAPDGSVVFLESAAVRRVSAQGVITTIAGNGLSAFSVETGIATASALPNAAGLAYDAAGNLYISASSRVLKMTPAGAITVFAGTGVAGFTGDNGLATSAQIGTGPLAVDKAGNVYAGGGNRVRKINVQGIISTMAGAGSAIESGDNGPATQAGIATIQALAFDPDDNLYITCPSTIRKVTPGGTISKFAGVLNGVGSTGNGGAATQANLSSPAGVAFVQGNAYLLERGTNQIRKIDSNGIITAAYGTGLIAPLSPDGTSGTLATLISPGVIAADGKGGIYVGDGDGFGRVVQFDVQGKFRLLAGGDNIDGKLAKDVRLSNIVDMISDASGSIYYSDRTRVYVLGPDGRIRKVAELPAFASGIYLALDSQGRLFIGESHTTGPERIYRMAPGGALQKIGGRDWDLSEGCGLIQYEGNVFADAKLCGLKGIAADASGAIYLAFSFSIYKVGADGIMRLFAGSGADGDSGDGGDAKSAKINIRGGIGFANGKLYLATLTRIRRVRADGIIETVAGTGVANFPVDGIPATQAQLFAPGNPKEDSAGNVYFTAPRLKRIGTDGILRQVSGGSGLGVTYLGNGLPAILLGDNVNFAFLPGGQIATMDLSSQGFVIHRLTPVGAGGCGYRLSQRAMSRPLFEGIGDVVVETACAWTATSNVPWIAITAGGSGTSSGTVQFSLTQNLGAPRLGTITIAGQTVSVLQEGTQQAFRIRPGDVTDAAGFGAALSPNAYAAVKPLGMPVTTVLPWDNAVPDGVTLPVLLNGVSIKLDGKNAAISYTSPTQINFLVPSDLTPGQVLMELTANGQTVYAVVKIEPYAPGLFAYPFSGRLHAVAQIAGTTTLVNSTADLPGSRPAKAGDFVTLYVNGLGGTAAVPPGVIPSQVFPVQDLMRVRAWIGNVPCEVQFAGAITAGLFQVNIKVPPGIAAGFQAVLLAFDQFGSQGGTGLWMQ